MMARKATKPAAKAKNARPKKPPTEEARTNTGKLKGFSGVFELQEHLDSNDAGIVVSFLIAKTASKSVAVNVAVTNQLIRDGRWPPMDLTKVMNAIPYRYTAHSMRNFLDGVAATLAAGLPPIKFAWDSAFVAKALPLTVAALMAEIELASK